MADIIWREMAIGKQNKDNRFYKGYEGEEEVIFLAGERTLHIWEGYFGDIFGNPIEKEEGWSGFTKDYNEFSGPFEDGCIEYLLNIPEYLADAKEYVGRKFDFGESAQVLDAIILFLVEAKQSNADVTVSVN